MAQQDNIKAQERFGGAINTGKFEIFQEVVSPDCVDHDPAPGQAQGPEGFATFFSTLRAAFPNMSTSVEHMVAADDNVTLAYTLSGTY